MSDRDEDGGKTGSTGSGEEKQLSRRRFLRTSLLGAAAAGAGLASGRSEAAGTGQMGPYAGHWWMRGPGYVPKAMARYQDFPNGQQHCAACRHFRAPYACEIVIGPISPQGWCQYFNPRV